MLLLLSIHLSFPHCPHLDIFYLASWSPKRNLKNKKEKNYFHHVTLTSSGVVRKYREAWPHGVAANIHYDSKHEIAVITKSWSIRHTTHIRRERHFFFLYSTHVTYRAVQRVVSGPPHSFRSRPLFFLFDFGDLSVELGYLFLCVCMCVLFLFDCAHSLGPFGPVRKYLHVKRYSHWLTTQ